MVKRETGKERKVEGEVTKVGRREVIEIKR